MTREATRAFAIAAVYLAAVAAATWYEIGLRIHDMAHAEFAGWMSAVLTLPTILVVNFLSGALFSARMGDSNVSFISIVACAALINAVALVMIARRIR